MKKSAVGYDQMTEPKASHPSIPRYEKPKLDGQGYVLFFLFLCYYYYSFICFFVFFFFFFFPLFSFDLPYFFLNSTYRKAIKSKFEQLAANPSAEQNAKIEAERKARQEREKQERERVRAEIEAKKAKEAESAPAPAPAAKSAPAPAPASEPEITEEPSAYQEYASVNAQEYQAEPQDIQEPPIPAHEEIVMLFFYFSHFSFPFFFV